MRGWHNLKKIEVSNSLFLYGISFLVTGILYLILNISLPKKIFLYTFLFRCWPIQFSSSWLFLIGLIYWTSRYSLFKKEEDAFQHIVLPEFSILPQNAGALIKTMPDKYKKTITLRRIREILQALIYQEDIIRLNEELSRRDITEVERGHSILDNIRNIVPVIGFLGTVIGLSLGMIQFPEVTDITALRTALKAFAASLSVAFDTTLLALVYTVLIISLASFLKQREEALVSKLDERIRILIGKIKIEFTQHMPQPGKGIEELPQFLNNALIQWKKELAIGINGFLEKFCFQNEGAAKKIEESIKEGAKEAGQLLSQKFEEIKEEIQRPPHYQIIVQPLQDKKKEND